MESTFDGSELPNMDAKHVTTDQIPSDPPAAGWGSWGAGAPAAVGPPGSSLLEPVSFPQWPRSRKVGSTETVEAPSHRV